MANMMGRKMGQIMVICLMAMMSTSSSALGDSRSIGDRLKPLSNDEDSKSPIKKAYTYVSEYKRLPVFNFGIGKRVVDVNTIKGAQPYAFGFGKRSNIDNYYPVRTGLDYIPYDNYDNYMSIEPVNTKYQTKRGGRIRHYDFGIGKRSVSSEYDLADTVENREDNEERFKKRRNDALERTYIYGLRNRFDNDQDDIQEDD